MPYSHRQFSELTTAAQRKRETLFFYFLSFTMRCARPSLYNRKRETSAEAEKPLVFYAARSCSSPFASENPLQQNAASHIELASFISGGSMNGYNIHSPALKNQMPSVNTTSCRRQIDTNCEKHASMYYSTRFMLS